jgi:copper ion binding protein
MSSLTTFDLPISGMTCSSCAGRVERALRKVPNVASANVNLASEQARNEAPADSLEQLLAAVAGAGYAVPSERLELAIDGMTCASCVGRVERALGQLPGVLTVSVNLATEHALLQVTAGLDPQTLLQTVAKAGYTATLVNSDTPAKPQAERHLQRERWALALALLLTAPLLIPMLAEPFGAHWMLPAWLQFALATPVQFVLGARFYRAAWLALRAGAGNMDQLVALGTSAAYGLSLYQWTITPNGTMPHLYFEASAVIISLILLGKYLESRAKRQTTSAIRALQALRPDQALRLRDGVEQWVALSALVLGDQVVVKPGERFPVDGQVRQGQSHADEALIIDEHRLAGEEVSEVDTDVDPRVETLLEGELYAEPDRDSAGLARSLVGGLHHTGTAAGDDAVAGFGQRLPESGRLRVLGRVPSRSGAPEHADRRPQLSKGSEAFDELRLDPQHPPRVGVDPVRRAPGVEQSLVGGAALHLVPAQDRIAAELLGRLTVKVRRR